MNPIHPAARYVAIAILTTTGAALGPAHAADALPGAQSAIQQMSVDSGAEISVSIGRRGLVSFLRAQPGAPVPVQLSGTGEERAASFLARYGAAFGLGGAVQPRLASVAHDRLGIEHLRYRQTYEGVLVTGGEISVHLSDRGVVAVNANTVADLAGLVTTPALTPGEALAEARSFLAAERDLKTASLSSPRLELLNRGLLGHRSFSTDLAWFVEVRDVDLREFVWVDARHGKIIFRFSQLTDGRDRDVYDAMDGSSLPGTLARGEGDSATGNTDVDLAYDYSGDTYDYFSNEHARDSFDDAGATLISTVDFCPSPGQCPFANAFWNGIQMVYGDGFPAADDVVGHELTHAVTEHTANLFYYMQSGALNESYSDVFGETIDLTNGSGTDTAGARWQMGEDVPGSGAIRDMEDPTLFGDPGKVSDAEFLCGDDYRQDNGGVHFNSGINNRAYSLAVDGGSFNGETVTGIGLTKAGKIWYRALEHYLLSASDFLDNYNAVNQSCQDLIGVASISAGDCSEVGKALAAVEMDDPWPCTPPQASVPAHCPVNEAPDILHYFDWESAGLGACPANDVPGSWCLLGPGSLLGSFATSGVNSAWGYNKPSAGTQSLTVTVGGGTLPADARMQFDHAFGFENGGTSYWDGGVVQYSIDDGGSFADAGSLIADGATYGGVVSTCCTNPLGGSSAFVADSWGYTASQLDLSSLAGNSFRYRFTVGTDFTVDEYGWFVDDVRIYTCAECVTDRLLDSAYNGTAGLYKATNSVTAGDGFKVDPFVGVRFEAGDHVALQNGFSVHAGDFAVAIEPCP